MFLFLLKSAVLLTAVLSCFLALFIWIKGHDPITRRLFALYSLSVSSWSLAKFIAWQSSDPILALWCLKLSIAASVFLPPLFWHFALCFVDKVESRRRFLNYLYGLSWILVFLTLSTNWLVKGVVPKWGLRFEMQNGPGYLLFFIYFVGVISLAMLELVWGLKERSYVRQTQIKYILGGALLGFGGGFLVFLSSLILDFPPIGYFFVPFYPLISAYTMVVHRLLDTQVIIRKSLVYAMLTLWVTGIYLFAISLTREIFKGLAHLDPIVVSFLVTLAFVFLFNPLRESIQKVIDQIFYREQINREAALVDFSKQINSRVDLTELMEYICSTLEHTFKLAQAKIQIGAAAKPDQFNLPLTLKDETLGVVKISPKLSGEEFTCQELDMLKAFLGIAASALGNALLYEKRLEQERELLRASQLATIGTLAAGMAHEIKNPLAAMKGMTQILPENLSDAEFINKYTVMIPRQIDRINHTIEALLKLGKTSPDKREAVDVRSLLEDIAQFFEVMLNRKHIELIADLLHPGIVFGNRDQLYQVIFNLVQNSVQAMPGGGRLYLKTYRAEAQEIAIEIRDTGTGILAEELKELFTPFFTTKSNGFGLGLFMVESIIKKHEGRINIESQSGQGTKVKIFLPAR